jgi:hypothetical protein
MRRLIVLGLVLVIGTAAGATASPSKPKSSSTLAVQLAAARLATAKYATDLGRAKADGYQIITRMIPNMGYHYLNPKITGFDVRKPPILVYFHRGATWQLGAIEWVFPKIPAKPPLPGAHYGAFGAGCHYLDGTFVPADAQDACPATSPDTGAKFNFWHPPLVTLHVWVWFPNPSGLFAGTNPLVSAFDHS